MNIILSFVLGIICMFWFAIEMSQIMGLKMMIDRINAAQSAYEDDGVWRDPGIYTVRPWDIDKYISEYKEVKA